MPATPPAAPGEAFLAGFEDGLRAAYGLPVLGPFTVFVEGLTDIDYLSIASEKVLDALGFDLLDAAACGKTGARIDLRTPLDVRNPDPEKRRRGGSVLLGKLIRFLRRYDSILESESRVCFVVDHDLAGEGTVKALKDAGFDPEYMSMTLDPGHHPAACSRYEVVVEDLLSVRVQREYFERGGCNCRVTYLEGVASRFEWDGPSKMALPAYVRQNGTVTDLHELARVLMRVRQLWGLPNPDVLAPSEPV